MVMPSFTISDIRSGSARSHDAWPKRSTMASSMYRAYGLKYRKSTLNLFLLPAAGPVGHGGYDIGASFISKRTGVQADVVVLHPAPFLFSKHFIIFFSLLVFAPDMGFDVL